MAHLELDHHSLRLQEMEALSDFDDDLMLSDI